MIDMTLEMAETAMKAAQAKARALRAPMTITVVDEAGRLVLTARGDGTGFFSPETSRAKAMAAGSFKKRTAELADLVAKGGFWSIVPTVLQGQILPTLGGSPILRAGRVIGAIGCGGCTGVEHQDCSGARAAADPVGPTNGLHRKDHHAHPRAEVAAVHRDWNEQDMAPAGRRNAIRGAREDPEPDPAGQREQDCREPDEERHHRGERLLRCCQQ